MGSQMREFAVRLPVGHTDDSGRVHRQAIIRKMRGHEEALLYDSALTAGQLVTELIRSCLVRLGEIEQISSDMVSRLYTADRNFLLLQLRRITLGDQLPVSHACPRCGADVSAILDLEMLPIRGLEEGESLSDISLQLEDGYTDRDGIAHTEIVISLPRGVDEEFVSQTAKTDLLRAQDILLLRCIRRFGALRDVDLEAYGIKILRDLTMGDRRRLHEALNNDMPGVDFRYPVNCGGCGAAFTGVIDVTNFFA